MIAKNCKKHGPLTIDQCVQNGFLRLKCKLCDREYRKKIRIRHKIKEKESEENVQQVMQDKDYMFEDFFKISNNITKKVRQWKEHSTGI
jgi:hypothetical protein